MDQARICQQHYTATGACGLHALLYIQPAMPCSLTSQPSHEKFGETTMPCYSDYMNMQVDERAKRASSTGASS